MKTASKLALLVGAAAGYVLGARAGRERYEQIAARAADVWESKPVQKQVDKAQGLVEQYVPKIVEDGFSLAGKGAAGLMSFATKSKQSNSRSTGSSNTGSRGNSAANAYSDPARPNHDPEAPTGTVANPAE